MSDRHSAREFNEWCLEHNIGIDEADEHVNNLHRLYARHRQSMFPGYRSELPEAKRHLWRRAFLKIMASAVSVPEYVSCAFQLYGDNTMVNHLLSDQVAKAAKSKSAYKSEDCIDMEARLAMGHISMHMARLGIPLETAIAELRDELPDVLIWCLAVKYNLKPVADSCAGTARLLLLGPTHRSVYSKLFPGVVNA